MLGPKLTDQDYLKSSQYHSAANLNARQQLHERFSTNSRGWLKWAFDQLELGEACRVLEVGCGSGDLWLQNRERVPAGWEVALADISPGMVSQARRNLAESGGSFTFNVGDVQSLPYPGESFEAVVANHMLYHIPERGGAFSEINRVLKPGGRLYAATNGQSHLKEIGELIYRFHGQIAPRNTAAKGKLFWLSFPPQTLADDDGPPKATLQMFELEKRRAMDLLQNVERYALAPDGSRLVYLAEKKWAIVEPKEGLKPGDGKLDLSGLAMELDPPKEWAQILRETWRLYRDFFYLPDMGKIDWAGIRKRYEPLLAEVSHRIDLNYLLAEMAADPGSGHAYVGGGDYPKPDRMPVGTLGADLVLDGKAVRWKIARILEGRTGTRNAAPR